ncbi:alpha/beta fold hydrolase [Streptomyces sp. NPDC050743]|uniref:alpha/beta fold hydrolase n=1 Tax=Streptomyces sp. NPDC050743 TaxID=3365634 RepID=UPI00379D5004
MISSRRPCARNAVAFTTSTDSQGICVFATPCVRQIDSQPAYESTCLTVTWVTPGRALEAFFRSGVHSRATLPAVPGDGGGKTRWTRPGWTTTDTAADVHAVVTQLGPRRPAIVGCSMGATIALQYALDHPKDLSPLVVRTLFRSGGRSDCLRDCCRPGDGKDRGVGRVPRQGG